ncbi:hypothetical protein D3C87_205470 [compost metagenome]
MKRLLLIAFLMLQMGLYAQKPCEYSSNFTDSIGSYKETVQKIVHEKNFAGTSSYIFFSLINASDIPLLNFQAIQKSKDFIKANCFDKNSKIYLQLTNGKIITLLISDEGNCGSMVRDEAQSANIRISSGSFLFMKNTMEELERSPVSLIRVKYATETIDYVMKKELVSELNGEKSYPENFFIDNLKCLN